MTLANKRHPKESNCVPLSGIFFPLKGKARVCRVTAGTRGHVMPCYPGHNLATAQGQCLSPSWPHKAALHAQSGDEAEAVVWQGMPVTPAVTREEEARGEGSLVWAGL